MDISHKINGNVNRHKSFFQKNQEPDEIHGTERQKDNEYLHVVGKHHDAEHDQRDYGIKKR